MRLSENRIIAWIVLAVCVVGSVVGLGGAGMARERKEILEVFYEGSDTSQTTRYSMDAYLDRALECCQIMAYEAQLALGEDHETAQKMLDTLADFGDDDGLDARYEAYLQLQQQSDALYNAMQIASMSDERWVNFKAAYDNFWGADKYIRKDSYRRLASDFNDQLDAFPANVICGLLGVDELNPFGA